MSTPHPGWATGVLAGAVTPFDDRLRIDERAFRAHLAWLADAGVASIVVAADTGEGQHLTARERLRLVELAVDEVGARTPILAGLIAGFTEEAAETARVMAAAGAEGLQVFPPAAFLGAPLDPGLAAAWFEAIAAATDLPLVAYRPPLALGFPFTDEVVARILAVEGVRALKESSFDEATYRRSLVLCRAAPGVAFLSGADTFVPRSLAIGADGLALALAAIAPRHYVAALARARRGDESDPDGSLEAIARVVFAQPFRDFRGRLKEALREMGQLASAAVRPPLLPLTAADRAAVASLVATHGLVGSTA